MTDRLRCFVIMPYSDRSDRLYRQGIIPVLRAVEGASILALRADEMGPREITLKAHVESSVQSSDFCIADLTGMNSNVIYELGFAMGLSKPVVTVLERGTGEVPSNLQGGVPVILYSLDDIAEFQSALATACSRLVTSLVRTLEVRQPTGSRDKLGALDQGVQVAFDRVVESVDQSFSALVGSPSHFVRELFPRLRERIEIRTRGQMRIVYPDPEAAFVQGRASVLGVPVAGYRQESWAALEELTSQLRSVGDWSGELRITESIITGSMYLSDNLGVFAPYLLGARSRQSLVVAVGRLANFETFEVLQRHFDTVWSSASPSRAVVGRSHRATVEDDA